MPKWTRQQSSQDADSTPQSERNQWTRTASRPLTTDDIPAIVEAIRTGTLESTSTSGGCHTATSTRSGGTTAVASSTGVTATSTVPGGSTAIISSISNASTATVFGGTTAVMSPTTIATTCFSAVATTSVAASIITARAPGGGSDQRDSATRQDVGKSFVVACSDNTLH